MSRKGWYGRHKDTWKPLKCRMVEITIKGEEGRKCDCENCPNNAICGIPAINRQVTNDLNRFFAEMNLFSGRHKHTYNWWRNPRNWKGTIYIFGYTPWRTEYNGKSGFWAFKYRQLKNGSCKLVKAVRFGRRKIARERSWKWHQQYYGENGK